MESELVDITLNIGGADYFIIVDLDTAQELLNDQSLAESYVKEAFPECFSENQLEVTTEEITDFEMPDLVVENENPVSESLQKDKQLQKVWFSKGKPSTADDEATIFFLKLREKYVPQFNDRKTVKNKLWSMIASEMKDAGWDICNLKEGPAGKCKQKFMNLQSQYIKHLEHMKRTGNDRKDAPPYFDYLHSILGDKHKVNPQFLSDSEACTSSHSDSDGDRQREEIKNRFKKTDLKPKVSKSESLLAEFKKRFKGEQKDRKEFINEFKASQKEQNEQRQQIIDLLSEIVTKKRREDTESNDSS